MQVRCPNCRNPIEANANTSLAEVDCPTCGSSFSLITGDATTNYEAGSATPGDATKSRDARPARRLAHFELVRELGVGTFGSVWLARDTKLDRTVAIKIPRQRSLSAEETEKFLRDARAAAQLKHPNIVGVHEVGREDDSVYIVTDYIDGANLRDWLTGQRLTFRESATLIVTVAQALHHAHQAGVVHRDLKPGNIMIDGDAQPHVIDFGLARRDAGEVTMTLDGHILGTPAYMSPEQAAGKGHQADRRSDVYSLGVILFELLTGELPFRGETQMLLLQIERDEPPRLRKLNGKIPRDLETITLKCLQKEPGRRFQTAADLAADLERWLRGESIAARPVRRAERGWRWCKRNPLAAGLAAAVVLALISGTVLSSYFALQANARASEAVAERIRAESSLAEASAQRVRADAERKAAMENLAVAEEQQRRAEESDLHARQTVDEYFTRVSQNTLLEEPRFVHLRKELLQSALKYYQEFLKTRSNQPALLGDIAATQIRVAVLTNELGSSTWLTPLKAAFENIDRLVAEHRDLSDFGSLVGGTYKSRSFYIRLPPGATQEYVDTLVHARATAQKIVDRFPEVKGFRNDLAGIEHALGMIYQVSGKMSLSMTIFRSSRDNWEKLVRDNPKVNDYQDGLATAYTNIGIAHSAFGQVNEQLTAYQQAFEIIDRLIKRNPKNWTYMQMLVVFSGNLAKTQWQLGQRDEANRTYDRRIEVQEQLHREYPADQEVSEKLAFDYLASVNRIREMDGIAEGSAGDRPELVERIDKALKLVGVDSPAYVDCCVAAGRWKEASESLARQLEKSPQDHMRWCQAACLDAYLADSDGHHRHCQQLLARYSGTKDPSTADRVAKACLALPVRTDGLEPVLQLADRAIAAAPGNGYFQLVKGLAEFRAGRFASASQWLSKSLSSTGKVSADCHTAATLLQAMTQHQLGNAEAARSWLVKAKRNPLLSKQWHDWLLVETLRREAEELLATTPPTDGLTKQTSNNASP